jgi:hypothetical protein
MHKANIEEDPPGLLGEIKKLQAEVVILTAQQATLTQQSLRASKLARSKQII